MLDRTVQPTLKNIDKINFYEPQKLQLNNSIPFFLMQAKPQSLVRLQVVFSAGTSTHTCSLIPSLAIEMLKEGTQNKTNKVLIEAFDLWGAYLDIEINQEKACLVIHVLEIHLAKILPLVYEILTQSVFPEKSFNTLLSNKKEIYILNQEKIKNKANHIFSSTIFKNTPYASNYTLETFSTVTLEEVKTYSQQFHQLSNAFIAVAGGLHNPLELINNYLGNIQSDFKYSSTEIVLSNKEATIYEPIKDSTQTALEIGKFTINRKHEDYHKLAIGNILFGGYFGSRLMSNIREDKGYTYGVYSYLTSIGGVSLLKIATEVGSVQKEDAIKEIYKELDLLKNELVSIDELKLVCNYILGSLLKNVEGNFEAMDLFLSLYYKGNDYTYYDKYIATLNTITPQDLIPIYQKYLNTTNLLNVSVG